MKSFLDQLPVLAFVPFLVLVLSGFVRVGEKRLIDMIFAAPRGPVIHLSDSLDSYPAHLCLPSFRWASFAVSLSRLTIYSGLTVSTRPKVFAPVG